jgi:outer membrane lipoprotein carrier protein
MVRLKHIVFILLALAIAPAPWVRSASASPADVDRILKGLEQHYGGKAFKASFFQESILKVMQITDTAEGHLIVRPPGKMRWEYTVPEPQSIITDGQTMWIYRPTDNQVMVGKAPEFFSGGKGAGFLSDVRQIRKSFTIQVEPSQNEKYHRLKLVPRKAGPELTDITLSVAKGTYRIDQVVTHNAYGDETRIVLTDYEFDIQPEEALFKFTVPKGVDVVQMEQF